MLCVIILCKGYIDVYIAPDVPGVFVLLPNCHDIKHTGHRSRTGYFDWDVCHTVICTKTPQSLFVVQQ